VAEHAVVAAHVKLPDARLVSVLKEAQPWFERLARCTLAGFATSVARPPDSDAAVVPVAPFGAAELYLPLAGLVDKAARAKELAKRGEELAKQIAQIEAKLGNEGFTARAPADVVAGERERVARLRDEREKVARQQAELAG